MYRVNYGKGKVSREFEMFDTTYPDDPHWVMVFGKAR